MNLQTGAFGDPNSTETLVLFWTKMEMLHYPGAGQTKKYLEEKLQREQEQAMQMQQAQLRFDALSMNPEQHQALRNYQLSGEYPKANL